MNEFKIKNGLIVEGQATAQGITSSLFGTASVAQNAISAAWAPSVSSGTTLNTGSTYPITSSWSQNATHAANSDVATSASFSTTSQNSNLAQTASSLTGLTLDNSSSVFQVTASNVVIISRNTGSFISAFFDYAVVSGSNIRAGTIFGAWNGSNLSYSEYTTVDVGDTSQVTMSLALNGSSIQLLANASSTINWTVKSVARYI